MPLLEQGTATPEHGRLPMSLILRKRYVPYALYLLLVGICWQGYYFRIGPDTISYISIAREYLAGQWWDAINTFWSPLFSWVIAAGMVAHAPTYALVRGTVAIWGLIGLAGIRHLTLQCGLSPNFIAGVVVIAAPMLASFVMLAPGPDFIALCLLTVYLSAVCNCCPDNRRFWLLAGIVGSLLYLTKAYMFGFVVAHLTFTAISRVWLSVGRPLTKKIVANYIYAMTCLLVLSGPWLIVIGLKAGHPTLSEAGHWNYAKAQMDPRWFPQLTEGLFSPVNPGSVSVWEDPGRMQIPPWNPLDSVRSFRRQVYVAARNCLYLIYFTIRASVFSIAIVPLFVGEVFRRIRHAQVFDCWACLLFAYIIYPVGYILIGLGEQRYVWIENVLLLVMGACVANLIKDRLKLESRLIGMAIILVGLSFWCDPLATLVYHWGDKRNVHALAQSLRYLKLSGNVASNGQWGDSLHLCYELGLPYYGIPKKQSTPDVERDLRKNRIKYLFIWNDVSPDVPINAGQELAATKKLKIYVFPGAKNSH